MTDCDIPVILTLVSCRSTCYNWTVMCFAGFLNCNCSCLILTGFQNPGWNSSQQLGFESWGPGIPGWISADGMPVTNNFVPFRYAGKDSCSPVLYTWVQAVSAWYGSVPGWPEVLSFSGSRPAALPKDGCTCTVPGLPVRSWRLIGQTSGL